MLEAREKTFVVYCVEGCGEIQKQRERNVVLIERSEKIVEYATENSLRAVPGPICRLVDAV